MNNDQTERRGIHLVGLAAGDIGVIFRELPTSDQGIDGQLELTDDEGNATGRLIAVQVKAGQSFFQEETNDRFTFRPSDRHRNLWMNHSLPVIVILCDPITKLCYWELVSEEACRSTGSGWRLDIPKKQTLDSVQRLEEIAAPVAAASDFTVANTDDVSTGLARRISLDVVVHPTSRGLSKIQLASIVRKAVIIGRKTDYSRDEISAAAHLGKEADMVSGFVYLREVDRPTAQWICRFQWTSNAISEEARYQGVPGQVDSDGLVIDWQLERPLATYLDERRRSKGEYLKLVDELVNKVPAIIQKLETFHADGCPDRDAHSISKLSLDFEESWDDSKSPPSECLRLDQAIGEILALVGNLRFFWGENSTYSRTNAERQSRRLASKLNSVMQDFSFLRREAR